MKMDSMTDKEFEGLSKLASPPSRSWKTVPLAFAVGGLICAAGEGLAHLYQYLGADTQSSFAAASVTLVFLSALFTGLNLYDDLAAVGGAGTLVPITGFANAIAAPALDFKHEGYILGLGVKLFAIAGPVIVYGTAAGVVYGLILWLFRLY